MQTLVPSICKPLICSHYNPAKSRLSRRVRWGESFPLDVGTSKQEGISLPLCWCLHTSSNEGENEVKTGEKLISVDDVLAEVEAMSQDFIFTDDDESPVWELEGKIQFSGPASSEMPKVKGALDPEALDITSAYSPEQGFMEMSVKDLHSMSHDVSLILDVRSQDEFNSGHVPEAVNVPLPELNKDSVRDSKLEEFKSKRVAVICASGNRSAQATVRLSKVLGFDDVVNVKGGTLEWVSEGYPVEK